MDMLRKTYQAWWNARSRCCDPKHKDYKSYGARGIKMCEAWQNSFGAFLRDVGTSPEKMVLDRIDNDGNYELGNVRWTDLLTSMRNKRQNGGRTPRVVRVMNPIMIKAW